MTTSSRTKKPSSRTRTKSAPTPSAAFLKTFTKTLRTVPDFPKPGIMFKDITPILKNKLLLRDTVSELAKVYRGQRIDAVVSIESRGFIFGAALAIKLGAGFIPLRKPNKLPATTLREEYALEYGTDALEMHADALRRNAKVIIHDDVLATGGTAAAAAALVAKGGGKVVGYSFLIELCFLNGRTRLITQGTTPEMIYSLLSIS